MSLPSSASSAPSAQDGRAVPDADAPPDAAPAIDAAPLDEAAASAARREADFRLFAGPNADIFMRTSHALEKGDHGRNAICWPGFLFPAAWFLYRKMYAYAAITILLPVVSGLFGVPGEVTRWLGFGFAFLGAFGRRLYVAKARRMIAEIRADAPDETWARETIARAGGTSRAGAVFGVLLIGAFLAFAFVRT